MKIFYLIPTGGYSTDLRSDTLWGMLCWGIRHLWGAHELEKFIAASAAGKPEFVISSAFPFKQHGTERIPFFPNPFALAPNDETADLDLVFENHQLRKRFKKVDWLSVDDFQNALQGKFTPEELLERLRSEYRIETQAREDGVEFFPSGQTVRRTAPRLEPNSITHNTIDRLRGGTLDITNPEDTESKAGQLFQAEEFFWADPHNETDAPASNTGLFFLAEGNTSKIEAVLRLFRHWGFGADRSTGKGFFEFEISGFQLDEPAADQSNALLNLSLFQPSLPELRALEKNEGCWQYLLERRQGHVGGYREKREKQPRLYFREGSVFARPTGFSGRYLGCIRQQEFDANHQPPHEVWDNGFGFMVNLNWKK